MATAAGLAGAPTTLDEFRTLACYAAEATGPGGEDVQGFPLRTSAQDMEAFIVSQGGRIWDPNAAIRFHQRTRAFRADLLPAIGR